MKTRRLTVSSIYANEKQVPAIRLEPSVKRKFLYK